MLYISEGEGDTNRKGLSKTKKREEAFGLFPLAHPRCLPDRPSVANSLDLFPLHPVYNILLYCPFGYSLAFELKIVGFD